MSRVSLRISALAAAAILATPAFAENPTAARKAPEVRGLPPAQIQAISAALSSEFAKKFLAVASKPEIKTWGDGSVAMTLDQSSLAVTVIGLSADGSVAGEVCVSGLDQAAALVQAGGPALEDR